MNFIEKLKQDNKKIHLTLIDPSNQQYDIQEIIKTCEAYGTNAFLVGGSTATKEQTSDIFDAIKKYSNLTGILFPNSADNIPENTTHMLFTQLLNSKDINYDGRQQLKAVPNIKKQNIETIPTGYIIVSTSKKPTTVEKLVDLNIIRINDIDKAVEYSLVAYYFDMSCIYLEAGSGAEKPVPKEMVKAVRENIKIPIIVGGGIRNAKTAKEILDAGADIIVTGTVIEKSFDSTDGTKRIEDIIKTIRNY